jgi:hypothetical protein
MFGYNLSEALQLFKIAPNSELILNLGLIGFYPPAK